MRHILADLKLLAAGVGIGALICAGLVGDPSDHVCGTVALVSVMVAVVFRFAEGRAA